MGTTDIAYLNMTKKLKFQKLKKRGSKFSRSFSPVEFLPSKCISAGLFINTCPKKMSLSAPKTL
jgi:hypothetical protein